VDLSEAVERLGVVRHEVLARGLSCVLCCLILLDRDVERERLAIGMLP
jgi:hypothetical protein